MLRSSVADNKNFHTAGVEYDQPYLYCTLTQPGDKVSLKLALQQFQSEISLKSYTIQDYIIPIVLLLCFFISASVMPTSNAISHSSETD